MTAHPAECEKADVGSLCDCDCAGARHAIRRTKGGVPGAGQVSKRAQQIAHRDNRAAVVNNRAEPDGPDVPLPDLPRRPKPKTVADRRARAVSAARPPRLSPATTAAANAARAGMPADRAGWHGVSTKPATELDPGLAARMAERVDRAKADVAAAEARMQAVVDKHTDLVDAELAKDKKLGWQHAAAGARREAAAAIAPHRAWDDPDWQAAIDERSAAQAALYRAEQAAETAKQPAYPITTGSGGLRMPTAELSAHLDSVLHVGRAALADARRHWEANQPPEVVAAARAMARHDDTMRQLGPGAAYDLAHLAGDDDTITRLDLHGAEHKLKTRADLEQLRRLVDNQRTAARQTVAKHQADTIRAMLAQHRPFGGAHHTRNVTAGQDPHGLADYGPRPARTDWQQRLTNAEAHFPDDWINRSAAKPLLVASSLRAYQSSENNVVSLPAHERDAIAKDGALDYCDEVAVHEFGHRMEGAVPGLTHLEFAYVRRRATAADGTVEPIRAIPGYDPREVSQFDRWRHAYTGKTYEQSRNNADGPGGEHWEVFQVGLQDLFGRSSEEYGPDDDPQELQAFVLGALLTL